MLNNAYSLKGHAYLHKVGLSSILKIVLHAILQIPQVVWLHLRNPHAASAGAP